MLEMPGEFWEGTDDYKNTMQSCVICYTSSRNADKNGIKCGVALFGETIFSLVTKDEKNKVKEILKQFDDGLIITSKIDSSGARLQ